MPQYKFTAVDALGKTKKDTIFATNMVEFNIKLKQENMFCLNVTEIPDEPRTTAALVKTTLKPKELSIFCKQFATMLNSGITIISALDVLYQQTVKPKTKEILLKVYEQVQIGKNLSEAMSSIEGGFPPFMISMVAAGEAAGALDTIMNRLSSHYEKDVKLKNKVSSAMVYPIMLMVVGFVVIVAMFTFVIPNIMDMLGPVEELPITTRALFKISNMFTTNWLGMLIGIAAIIFFISMAKYISFFGKIVDFIKLKAPGFGKLYVQVMSASFCRSMSSMYSSGMSLLNAIELTSNVVNNSVVKKKLEFVVDEIKRGGSLSVALTKTEIFPQMMITMIKVGEESGELDTILEKTSDFYDEEADAAIQKMVALMEPLMIAVLGGIVGLVVVSILGPIYSGYSNVGV